MPKGNPELKKYNSNEIQKTFEFQQKNNLWNFYDEREFLENLLASKWVDL